MAAGRCCTFINAIGGRTWAIFDLSPNMVESVAAALGAHGSRGAVSLPYANLIGSYSRSSPTPLTRFGKTMTRTSGGWRGDTARSFPRCQDSDDLTLISLHTAIRPGGIFAKSMAARRGFRDVADTAQRVVIVLAAHAVETAGNPDPNPHYRRAVQLHVIGVRISRQGHGLLVEECDNDPASPHDPDRDHHLSLVVGVSRRWNCSHSGNGKASWAELAALQPRHVDRPAFTSARGPTAP